MGAPRLRASPPRQVGVALPASGPRAVGALDGDA